MNFLNTFRGRLLVILAFLLIATLGFQYYVNYTAQEENAEIREKQEQTIFAAIRLALKSITSDYRMQELLADPNQSFFDDISKQRIKDIIIIDNNWNITDSLNNPDYLPDTDENGNYVYQRLE